MFTHERVIGMYIYTYIMGKPCLHSTSNISTQVIIILTSSAGRASQAITAMVVHKYCIIYFCLFNLSRSICLSFYLSSDLSTCRPSIFLCDFHDVLQFTMILPYQIRLHPILLYCNAIYILDEIIKSMFHEQKCLYRI